MGSEDFYPEEAPVREVAVDGFWMDEHAVSAADFRRFVRDTGYVTVAERPLDPKDYPDADPEAPRVGLIGLPEDRRAGAAERPSQLVGVCARRVLEAAPAGRARRSTAATGTPSCRSPTRTPRRTPYGAGKELPTEAEWEYAARGGLDGAAFAWGDEHSPGGKPAANTWQGEFPWQNLKADGFEGTAPVGSFPPNGYGLYEMTGNTWEWTSDWFSGESAAAPCCAPDPLPGENFPRRVIKGGSHLCAPNYCLRYRPAARQGETIDTATSHIGFRCVIRLKGDI